MCSHHPSVETFFTHSRKQKETECITLIYIYIYIREKKKEKSKKRVKEQSTQSIENESKNQVTYFESVVVVYIRYNNHLSLYTYAHIDSTPVCLNSTDNNKYTFDYGTKTRDYER